MGTLRVATLLVLTFGRDAVSSGEHNRMHGLAETRGSVHISPECRISIPSFIPTFVTSVSNGVTLTCSQSRLSRRVNVVVFSVQRSRDESNEAWFDFGGGRRVNRSDSRHRRRFLFLAPTLLASSFFQNPKISWAQASSNRSAEAGTSPKKPYAPLEALIPATLVRRKIDRAYALVKEGIALSKDDSDAYNSTTQVGEISQKRREEIMRELESILLGATSASFGQARAKFRTKQDSPSTTITTTIEDLSNTQTVRQAFNEYTANMRFGESYVLTASPSDKSNLIRKYNGLPNVKTVITSDLDLRDLYRNQVLTALDDVKAEFQYQQQKKRQSKEQQQEGSSLFEDGDELLSLLQAARDACNQWFNLIPTKDVQEALATVIENEKRS